ncbi:MAG: 4-vinyl reductase [Deltaproteobacteria bacterium]|uniref:4-vinyl reductase n=1 Tax=Candidatus Zymogenus saltonus TaxID=2844893 RepID=A0A9D8KEI2_9DELT|nr:4-vinyl reductase [Candidatus Zymogenus saltonus]
MEDRLVSNMTFRVMLLGINEIVGQNGLDVVLNFTGLTKYRNAIPPNNDLVEDCWISEATGLDKGIEEIFGGNGAAAILVQVGKKQAVWGLEENGEVAGQLKKTMDGKGDFERIKMILTITATIISAQMNTEVWIEEDDDAVYYCDKSATHCFNRTSILPVCFVTVGFLLGLVEWATGKNDWRVKETRCMALGEEYCAYRVSKRVEH